MMKYLLIVLLLLSGVAAAHTVTMNFAVRIEDNASSTVRVNDSDYTTSATFTNLTRDYISVNRSNVLAALVSAGNMFNARINTSFYKDLVNETVLMMLHLDNSTLDSSQYGNYVVARNGLDCSPSVSGKLNTACSFDGSDDFLNRTKIPDIEGSVNYTIAMWIKTAGVISTLIFDFLDTTDTDWNNGTQFRMMSQGSGATSNLTSNTTTVYSTLTDTNESDWGGTFINMAAQGANNDNITSNNVSGEYVDTFGASVYSNWTNITVNTEAYYGTEVGRGYGDGVDTTLPSVNMSELIGLWHLNDRVADSEGENHGLAQNGAQINTSGRIGNAGQFDGVDDRVDISFSESLNFSGLEEISISTWFWAKPNQEDADPRLVNQGNEIVLRIDAANQQIDWILNSFVGTDRVNSFSDSFNFSIWNHVIGTFNGSNLTIYINGKFERSANVGTGTYGGDLNSWAIGFNSPGVGYKPFNGSIDDVAIYNRTLSAGEVNDLFVRGNSSLDNNVTWGRVAYWKMDEDTWSVKDSSGQNNNGTSIDGVLYNSSAVFNSSLTFDGIDDVVTLPASLINVGESVTISAWFNSNNITAQDGIIESLDSSYHGYYMGFETGSADQVRCYFENNDTDSLTVIATTVLENNNWYHTLCSYDGSTLRIYLNGNEQDSGALTGNISLGEIPRIGAYDEGSDTNFNGSIDEVAIWNRTLSAEEIKNLYLRGAWRLNLSVRSCDDSACSGESFAPVTDTNFMGGTASLSAQGKFFQYNLTYVNKTEINLSSDNLTVNDVTVNLKSDVVTTGHFLSQIFDANTTVTWNNISVSSEAYYGTEVGRGYGDGDVGLPSVNTTGLVALYHFNNESAYNENDTHVYDFSGFGNNGTIVNDSYYELNDKVFGASSITFSGNNSYVDFGSDINISGIRNFTISLWINPETWDHVRFNGIISKRDNFTMEYDWEIYYDNATREIRMGIGPGPAEWLFLNDDVNPSTGVWHHLAVVKSNYSYTLYLDGVNLSSDSSTVTIPFSSASVRLGTVSDVSTFPPLTFNGSIDEVSIWNRSLSVAEIRNLYLRGVARLNLSVRGCDDDACSGEVFTSVTNTSFMGGLATLSLAQNRYFQYNLSYVNNTPFNGSSSVTVNDAVVGYTSSGTNASGLFTQHFGTSNIIDIYLDSSGYLNYYTYQGGAADVADSTGLYDDNWHHVAVTKSGTTGTIYVDGSSRASDTVASVTGTGEIVIGTRWDQSDPFSGTIDEVIVYNRSLSASEVNNLYRYNPYYVLTQITQDSKDNRFLATVTNATYLDVEDRFSMIDIARMVSTTFGNFAVNIPERYPIILRLEYDDIDIEGNLLWSGLGDLIMKNNGLNTRELPRVGIGLVR